MTARAATAAPDVDRIHIAAPRSTDGTAVNALITRCPPLDHNSLYCNVLQCVHFARTSALARLDGETVGFVSGYLLPSDPNVLFIWQVAVDTPARGCGLARRMVRAILSRPTCAAVRYIHTTVTPGNRASRRMFTALAGDLGTTLNVRGGFDRDLHLGGSAETEELLVIGPFAATGPAPDTGDTDA